MLNHWKAFDTVDIPVSLSELIDSGLNLWQSLIKDTGISLTKITKGNRVVEGRI